MARTRFQFALKDIISFFERNSKKVFSFKEIDYILSEKRMSWRLPIGMGTHQFLSDLLSSTKFQKVLFSFPKISISRYSWGESNIYELSSGLLKNSYFCHYSAIYLHNLTEQDPKSIYLNYEQSPKPNNASSLSQSSINMAFSRLPKFTNNFCTVGDYRIYLLNGKKTGRLGVVNKGVYSVTDLERTLIDITVRPQYSGGVFEVLKAFKNARSDLSVTRLSVLLKKLGYIYPYHQSIGFYLEKAGYSSEQLSIFENFSFDFDFYLTNQLVDPEYSSKWRVFYPKGF